MIEQANQTDYSRLEIIWETAVIATHDFLNDEDFRSIKSRLRLYFDNVDLYVYRIDGSIKGFLGVVDDKVEMLFVHNACRGIGIGTILLKFAIDRLHVKYVDVNEQNTQAKLFYEKAGFRAFYRQSSDSEGLPYPIIKMQLGGIVF